MPPFFHAYAITHGLPAIPTLMGQEAGTPWTY